MAKMRLFPAWMTQSATTNKKPTTKTVVVFPCGTESEVLKHGNLFICARPDGAKEENSVLRDLKHWLASDYPGVRFERRPA